jgi:hypothetical protein
MIVKKAKLVEQLKKRRQQLIDNHKALAKSYIVRLAAYKLAVAKQLDALRCEVEEAQTVDKVYSLICNRSLNPGNRPVRPSKHPRTEAIDKALLELELCEDADLTLEASRGYLKVMGGEYDRDEIDEYDDEEED